jgi:hypothetical protein
MYIVKKLEVSTTEKKAVDDNNKKPNSGERRSSNCSSGNEICQMVPMKRHIT